jgi:hypothetical protein
MMARAVPVALVFALALAACAHTPPQRASDPGFAEVPPATLRADKRSGDLQLSQKILGELTQAALFELNGVYKICVDPAGRVVWTAPLEPGNAGDAGDRAVMARLRTWTFQPAGAGRCAPLRVHIDIAIAPPPWKR